MNSRQLRELVRETLQFLDPVIPYSPQAEDLVLMTIAHESQNGAYLKQVNGPALGICQMEPRTHDDIWDCYLCSRDDLSELIYSLSIYGYKELRWMLPAPEEMVWNLKYAIAMCRVHYYRVPEALPELEPLSACLDRGHQTELLLTDLSKYAKKYYNTELGKATSDKYLQDYLRFYGA